jgi:hypothetical protein
MPLLQLSPEASEADGHRALPRERLHKMDTRQRLLRSYLFGPASALAACQYSSRQHTKYCRGNPENDAATDIQKCLNNSVGAAQIV